MKACLQLNYNSVPEKINLLQYVDMFVLIIHFYSFAHPQAFPSCFLRNNVHQIMIYKNLNFQPFLEREGKCSNVLTNSQAATNTSSMIDP